MLIGTIRRAIFGLDPTKTVISSKGHSPYDSSTLLSEAPEKSALPKSTSGFLGRLKGFWDRIWGRTAKPEESQSVELTAIVVQSAVEVEPIQAPEPKPQRQPATIKEALQNLPSDSDTQAIRDALLKFQKEVIFKTLRKDWSDGDHHPRFSTTDLNMTQLEISALFEAIEGGDEKIIKQLLSARQLVALEHIRDELGRSVWEAAVGKPEILALLGEPPFIKDSNMTQGEIESLFDAVDKLDPERVERLLEFRKKANLNKIRDEQGRSVFEMAGMKRKDKDDPNYQKIIEILNRSRPIL